MGMPLKQAKRGRQDHGRAGPDAERWNSIAATNEWDVDELNEDASSTSDDRPIDEMPHDRREKDDGQPEDRDEQEGTKDTAVGEADGRRRNTNKPEDTNMQATRVGGQQQTEKDEDDYFTAREEPGTEATTARARRETSEDPVSQAQSNRKGRTRGSKEGTSRKG
jgi:hypothetical protein